MLLGVRKQSSASPFRAARRRHTDAPEHPSFTPHDPPSECFPRVQTASAPPHPPHPKPRDPSTPHLGPGMVSDGTLPLEIEITEISVFLSSFFAVVIFSPVLSSLFYPLKSRFLSYLSFLFRRSASVKRANELPRYVRDASPPDPTARVGKEVPAKSRLQGSPSHWPLPCPPIGL